MTLDLFAIGFNLGKGENYNIPLPKGVTGNEPEYRRGFDAGANSDVNGGTGYTLEQARKEAK